MKQLMDFHLNFINNNTYITNPFWLSELPLFQQHFITKKHVFEHVLI